MKSVKSKFGPSVKPWKFSSCLIDFEVETGKLMGYVYVYKSLECLGRRLLSVRYGRTRSHQIYSEAPHCSREINFSIFLVDL